MARPYGAAGRIAVSGTEEPFIMTDQNTARRHPSLLSCVVALVACASIAGPAWAAEAGSCPLVTKVRIYPRDGHAERMAKGRIVGSNEGPTTGFVTIGEMKDAPPEKQWTDVALSSPLRFRYVKYESPNGGWGNVAELEFYAGDARVTGAPFGTTGSRDNGGNDFAKALDGDTATFFDGVNPNSQYVGLDLGEAVQTKPPTFSPPPGAFDAPVEVAIASPTPGAKVRYTRDGQSPTPESGEEYRGPIKLEKGEVLAAVAYTDRLAASAPALGAYRVGAPAGDAKRVRTFHIGNSLTDTIDGFFEPLAASAGRPIDFHRFTIPGAPTDWLWEHPGSGFGDSRYEQAFFALAPIDHLSTQPFAGHGRSIENEADHSGRFYDAARKHSPDVQMWLYVQWPDKAFTDSWAKGEGAVKDLNLKPATTWQAGVANHLAYTEAVRDRMNALAGRKPVLIVPAGPALAALKTEIEGGRVPGMSDFFGEMFSDDLHLSPKGRYLVSLVFYACLFKESPEGKASALTTGLTPEQAKTFQRIAFETTKNYRGSGVGGATR